MEYEVKIRKLLDTYFEGGTTLEEEKELREFFSSGVLIPEDLRYAQIIFNAMDDASGAKPKREFKPEPASIKRNGRKPLWIGIAASAAVIALIMTLTMKPHFIPGEKEVVYCYINGEPVTDYQTAARYAEEIKTFISSAIQKPIERLAPIEELTNTLDIISRMEELVNSIAEPKDTL